MIQLFHTSPGAHQVHFLIPIIHSPILPSISYLIMSSFSIVKSLHNYTFFKLLYLNCYKSSHERNHWIIVFKRNSQKCSYNTYTIFTSLLIIFESSDGSTFLLIFVNHSHSLSLSYQLTSFSEKFLFLMKLIYQFLIFFLFYSP